MDMVKRDDSFRMVVKGDYSTKTRKGAKGGYAKRRPSPLAKSCGSNGVFKEERLAIFFPGATETTNSRLKSREVAHGKKVGIHASETY